MGPSLETQTPDTFAIQTHMKSWKEFGEVQETKSTFESSLFI